ncbi:hypothetical protein [Permianibacter aggregans]|uniref:Uncharacterized protein n=1 Tax=Permianibacter aggregans TaxID=1510150 RepID=A0A4R6UFJ6_9GAMM|nr:hypothetical protein [Permianibacter aggregans]TDQ45600.1 hypothetical protein EV696_11968 [Permianibacter aggregans]
MRSTIVFFIASALLTMLQVDYFTRASTSISVKVGMSFFVYAVMVGYFILGVKYTSEWIRMNGSLLAEIIKRVWLPVCMGLFVFKFNPFLKIESSLFMLTILTGVMVLLLVVDGAVRFLDGSIKLKDKDMKLFFAVYPPKKRSDMMYLDILFALCTFLLFKLSSLSQSILSNA